MIILSASTNLTLVLQAHAQKSIILMALDRVLGCVPLGWSGTGVLQAALIDRADLIFLRLAHAPTAPSQKVEQPEQFDTLSYAQSILGFELVCLCTRAMLQHP